MLSMRPLWRRAPLILPIAVCLAIAGSCSGGGGSSDGPPPPPGLTVSVSPAYAGITVTQTLTLVDTTKTAVGVLARDGDGATIVTAAQLGLLPAGSAKLGVARFRLTYRTVSGHKIGMACESTRLRSLTLN